jgi:hypothetical protein
MNEALHSIIEEKIKHANKKPDLLFKKNTKASK